MKTLFLITFQALLFNLYAQDTLSPTLICRQGYFTIHLNSKSSVTINATEFDQGSYDNVTPKDKYKQRINEIKNQAKIHEKILLEEIKN